MYMIMYLHHNILNYLETDIDITKHRKIYLYFVFAQHRLKHDILSFCITVIQHYIITYIFISI